MDEPAAPPPDTSRDINRLPHGTRVVVVALGFITEVMGFVVWRKTKQDGETEPAVAFTRRRLRHALKAAAHGEDLLRLVQIDLLGDTTPIAVDAWGIEHPLSPVPVKTACGQTDVYVLPGARWTIREVVDG